MYRLRLSLPSLVLFALIALPFDTSVQAGPSGRGGVTPREVVLDNGLKLLLVERREQPTVAAGVFYNVGSVNDPRGKSGIAHLFEHMLFKGSEVIGTTNYESERGIIRKQDRLREKMITEMNRMREMKRLGKISDVLDPSQWTPHYTELKKQYGVLVETARQYIKNNEFANLYTTNGGARMNAGTMHDLTMYFVQLPTNKIELFFWLESDRMAGGIMREFYVERDNVREERRLRVESTPTGKFDESFNAMFWESHPYGIPVLGWPSEVESITREDVRAFYKIYYAPNNATLALVGDFDSDEMIDLAKRYFGRIPHGSVAPPPVLTEESKPNSVRRMDAEAETNPRVRIRFHGVAIGHRDEAALDVVGALLSGKTGRLYKRLVTHEDMVIGEPRASHQGRKYAGHFEISTTVKDGANPEEVESVILDEILRLRDSDISDRELQKVKNQVLASSIQQLRSNFGLMFRLGLFETWYDWNYINESPELMLKVTAGDIQRVIGRYLDPDTRTVAIYRTKSVTPQPTPNLNMNPENQSDGIDAEYYELVARLPKKVIAHLDRRLKQLESLNDPEDIEFRSITLLQAVGASGKLSDAQREMFEYVLAKMNERSRNLRYKRWEKKEQ